jgi:hypothetical protein
MEFQINITMEQIDYKEQFKSYISLNKTKDNFSNFMTVPFQKLVNNFKMMISTNTITTKIKA